MCLVCIEWQKGRLTMQEAISNTLEMVDLIGEEHAGEVFEMVSNPPEDEEE